jgi:hypothetical protein
MNRTTVIAAGVIGALAIATAGTAGVQALITSAQIKDGTIASRDIKNGAIGRADLADAAEAALRGRRGPTGSQGPVGPAGATGPAGPQGASGPQGPQGATGAQGPAGPQGAPGAGVEVTGTVATVGDLPSGAAAGDAYIVAADGHLHVWTGSAWIDTGEVRGPQGPQGATGPTGPAGPAGPQGSTGATGPTGPAGADGGLAGYEIVSGAAVAIAAGEVETATVNCPAGKVVTGGGASVTDPTLAGLMAQSFPAALGDGWTVSVWNESGAPTSMTPYAICANTA